MSIRMGDKILAANYKPNNATQDVVGLVRLATEEEITEGIATESVVTPYQLKETVNNKANIDLDNLSETGETRFNGKANIDLDNLSEVGEKHFLNKQQITNCLTEVPQRIKLELNNGTLTLKAGSEVIIPKGFEEDGVTPRFDYVTVENDLTLSKGTGTEQVAFVCDATVTSVFRYTLSLIYSGPSAPTISSQYAMWYDTTNNIVKYTDNTGNTWISGYWPLPLGIGTTTTSAVTSVDQIFNGMGYIGSTIWVDKGVKGLIPNGRNADGSLKNDEVTTDKIYISTRVWGTYSLLLGYELSDGTDIIPENHLVADNLSIIYEQPVMPTATVWKWIDTANNQIWFKNENGTVAILQKPYKIKNMFLGRMITANGKITSFNPKLPFRAVDYSEYVNDIDGLAKADDLYGIWNGKGTVLTQNAACSSSTATSFNLSNYLPKDGNNYEVLIDSAVGIPKGQVGKRIQEVISTSIQTGFYLVEVSSDYNNYPSSSAGNAHCAVGPDRKLNVSFKYSTGTGTYSLYARGYRKIR